MDKEKDPLPVYSSLSALCAMMGGDEYELPLWSAHDLSSILKHLLVTPVERELTDEVQCREPDPSSGAESAVSPLPGGAPGALWTFQDVLARRDVSREMLIRVKNYAKRAMDSGGLLPRDAAKALYVAVIAHARACGHPSVSSLPAASFERAGRWCMAQSWIPPEIREAVREGLRKT